MNIFEFAFWLVCLACLSIYLFCLFQTKHTQRTCISSDSIKLNGMSYEIGNITFHFHVGACILSWIRFKHPVFVFRCRILLLTLFGSSTFFIFRTTQIESVNQLVLPFVFLGILFLYSILFDAVSCTESMLPAAYLLAAKKFDDARLDTKNGVLLFLSQGKPTGMCPVRMDKSCLTSEKIDIYIGFGKINKRFALCCPASQ